VVVICETDLKTQKLRLTYRRELWP